MSPIDENGVIVLTRDGVGGPGPLGHPSPTQKVEVSPNMSTHSMASLPPVFANPGTFLIQQLYLNI